MRVRPIPASRTAAVLALPALLLAAGPSRGGQGDDARFTTELFASASLCAPCHDGLATTSGEVVSLAVQWRGSLMAYAFTDPFWQAKVRSETLRNPHLSELIEDKCATCHAPMAKTESARLGLPVTVFGEDGLVDPDHPFHDIATEVVGCTLCHQVRDTPELGTPAGASGGFSVAGAGDPEGRRIYGPYPDPFGSMIGAVDYRPLRGAQVEDSALCATCHDLETPYVDAAGVVVSTPETLFPEQMPYREWKHSDFGPEGSDPRACPSCHMTVAGDGRIARGPKWLPLRADLYRHHFRSENTTILEILSRYCADLGCTGEGLDEAVDAASGLLGEAATLEVAGASLESGLLEVTVRVVNRTGHKLPTGIPVRRAFLHATVRDAAGQVVFESGRPAEDGAIAGVDADVDPLALEPHHDLITSEDQVQVYEGVMRTVEGGVTWTLLRASGFLKDNRLLPRGLEPAVAPPALRPVGACLEDANFAGGSDEVTYRVAGLRGRRYTVDVELLDQSLSYGVVRDLRSDAADPYVARMIGLLELVPPRTEKVAGTSVVVSREGAD